MPTPIPVWFVALVLAAAAPWGVRMLQAALERRLRRRTLAFIAEALAAGDRDPGLGHGRTVEAPMQAREEQPEQRIHGDAARRT
jgi:hypothetical protein